MSEDWKSKYEAEVEAHRLTVQMLSDVRFQLIQAEEALDRFGISNRAYLRAFDEVELERQIERLKR